MSIRTFDDRDPAIQYSTLWELGGGPEEYNGTTTFTTSAEASARVTFTGTGIAVFGTTLRTEILGSATSTYTIENTPSTSARFVEGRQEEDQFSVNFYNISDLEFGRHVLAITKESPDGQLILDYFTVTGSDLQSGSPISSSPIPPASSNSVFFSTDHEGGEWIQSAGLACRTFQRPQLLLTPSKAQSLTPPLTLQQ